MEMQVAKKSEPKEVNKDVDPKQELVVKQEQQVSISTEQRLAQDVDTYCKAKMDFATQEERQLFFSVATARRLNPLANQLHAVPRKKRSKNERGQWEEKTVMEIQTGIDGLRLIAERSDKYAGQVGPHWCGKDGVWKDVWLEKNPPAAARVGVLKTTFKEPLYSIALFEAYAQVYDGKPTYIWEKMGASQLAKCAEALALRKAFPEDMGGLYTNDEMAQAEQAEPKDVGPKGENKNSTSTPQNSNKAENHKSDTKSPVWWIENAANFGQSRLNFGQERGKTFDEIGAVALNDIMQKAIKEAKDQSKIPKEFMDLAIFVENWMLEKNELAPEPSFE